jgi:hypothetical protein
MTATIKRYSYLRVTAIRIDVHPGEDNLIDMPHAFHTRFAYGPRPYISRDPRRQPFASSHKDEIGSYTREKSWVTSFPVPHNSLGVGERGFSQVVTQLHQLTGPITPACDQYVQYLLTGANPSVLNRHRWGLQSWRCRLSTHHSLTFLTDGPPFSIKGPAQSPV